jgi:hypothetical protein
VRAVGSAERVVHVHICQRRELVRQAGVVLRLAALPASVLEHQDRAGSQPVDSAPHLRADDLGRLVHLGVDQLTEPLGRGTQRGAGVAARGASQVRAQHDARRLLQEQLDRWQRGTDAGVVRDPTLLHGNVEVHPGEHTRAFLQVEVADRALA